MLLEKYHKTVPGPEPKSSTCDGLKFGSRDETYTIPPNSFHKDGSREQILQSIGHGKLSVKSQKKME